MENTKKPSNDLTTGSVWKKFLGFYFPVLLGLLFQQLYSTVDAAIVGACLGSSALAAVGGSASQIINVIIGLFAGLNGGATVIISHKFGADNREGLQHVLHTAITFCTITGIAISVMGYIGAPALLRLTGTPADTLTDSVTYLRIIFIGAMPLLMYNLFQGTLQAVGNSRLTLMYLIISCCMNIVLDYVFVAIIGWGIAGAAWATVIAMVTCALLSLMHCMRTKNAEHIDLRKLTLDGAILRDTLRIGLPSGLQGTMYNLSNLIIQTAVNSFGTTIVAAWAATGRLDGFYWITTNAMSITIAAFVGQCVGARKYERMRKCVRTSMIWGMSTTIFLSALLLLIARPAYMLILHGDLPVVENAITIMNFFVPFYFVWTVVDVFSGTFRGAGDTFRPMIITMLGTCLLRVLWIAFILPLHRTVLVLCLEYVVSWVITGTAMVVYYRRANWLRGVPREVLFGKKESAR